VDVELDERVVAAMAALAGLSVEEHRLGAVRDELRRALASLAPLNGADIGRTVPAHVFDAEWT
jgi:hypothetical protein